MDPVGSSGSVRTVRVQAELERVVETFENAFPDRVRGYYIHGSVADNTSIGTSDVDLDVVVKGQFQDAEEQAAFARVARSLREGSDLELDVQVTDEATLLAGAEPTFIVGSRLLYGEDIRDRVPLIPVEEWGRERMYRGYFLMVRVFSRPVPVRYPIGFPDPDAEFLGYTNRQVTLHDGTAVLSTRNLIRVTGWLATALIAYEGRRYVARKRDCHLIYREVFHDVWASLLEEIYVTCRGRWHSLIPDGPGERAHLREICTQVLAFENHFLTRFKPFILAELEQAGRGKEGRAAWLMREIPLEDELIGPAAS